MIVLALVAITMYAGPYVGEPLYCGGFYDDATVPWVAMPDWFWENGGECGHKVGVMIDGEGYFFTVLDRMAPGDWYVIQPDGEWLPIRADLPKLHAPFDGLSTVGKVWNVTLLQRDLEARIGRWIGEANVLWRDDALRDVRQGGAQRPKRRVAVAGDHARWGDVLCLPERVPAGRGGAGGIY